MSSENKQQTRIPRHVAIIMDGNGRWAAKRGLPRMAGHRAGTENIRRIIRAAVEQGIEYLTLYAFSTENWRRPKEEVDGLMNILGDVIERELNELNSEGVRLCHIGHLEGLSPELRNKVTHAMDVTQNNDRLTLTLGFNYGGRDELICAIKQMLQDQVNPEDIDEQFISKYLFTSNIPDPDLVIRTSGEIRTSNFLIWQASYAEWYFTPTLWPDFDQKELIEAVKIYSHRERRFGRVDSIS